MPCRGMNAIIMSSLCVYELQLQKRCDDVVVIFGVFCSEKEEQSILPLLNVGFNRVSTDLHYNIEHIQQTYTTT